jgi:DMSO/TMAO reductase YedYZ molybdopterin-dependent catalytic subunit
MAVPEPVLEFPLAPEQNTAFVTPSDKLFVLAHLGVPQIRADSWSFDVVGLVGAPVSLRYADLEQFTPKTVSTIFQCAGNPLDPTKAFRLVANLEWRGVLLREILELAQVDPSCRYVWAYGLDHGTFYSSPRQEHYVKDLPLEYVMKHDVIVATHLNGEPLSPKHGFPARVVAPGYYGTNSVKWLCRVEAANRRANGHFTRELYNDPIPGTEATKPVWDIAPESVIVSPGKGNELKATGVLISGWAWSFGEITTVEVSTDGGKTWAPAEVEAKKNGSWQRFSYQWAAKHAGHCELLSRATDRDGRTQPIDGARNAVYRVGVTVVSEEARE